MRQSDRWQLWVGLTFAVLAVLAAGQHDWEVAGTLLGLVAFHVLLLVKGEGPSGREVARLRAWS
jgi:hypothetical protein